MSNYYIMPEAMKGYHSNMQGDRFTGKPQNVMEFDSCLQNVRKITKRRNCRGGGNLIRESRFITNFQFRVTLHYIRVI